MVNYQLLDNLLKSLSFLCLNLAFDCNESNSEHVTFELCELEAALLDGKTSTNRSCQSECFVIIVDKECEEKDGKHIVFLLTLVGKEILDLGNAKTSMPFFLANNFIISSYILVLTHALTEVSIGEGSKNKISLTIICKQQK